MTKAEMIRKIVKRIDGKVKPRRIKEANLFYETMIEIMEETFAQGDDIKFPGFCKFLVIDMPPHRQFHPTKGKVVTFPAKRTIRFKMSENLRKLINGK